MQPKETPATRPNQAAAAIEHVVVRGMDNGNTIRTEVVVNDPNIGMTEDTSILNKIIDEHHGDPPETNNMGEDARIDLGT